MLDPTFKFLFYIDLIFFQLFLISMVFLFLDLFLSDHKYKDNTYNTMFFIFMFTLGYVTSRILL